MQDTDYVLGTHDAEIARLGLQHQAWRPMALEAWRRAGFTRGDTVLDIGCGPGYAALDLAEWVGVAGQVVAVDRSSRFLAALEAACARREFRNLSTVSLDLNTAELPAVAANRAWCRWVLAFLERPQDLLARVARALRPGGAIALHEYFDYSTWRATTRCPELEEFVAAVMESWRASGGEPDIGLRVPGWLEELGFEIRSARPVVRLVQPADMLWLWLRAFVEVGRSRLVELGYFSLAQSESTWQAFCHMEKTPGARMITPGVLEIVATRR